MGSKSRAHSLLLTSRKTDLSKHAGEAKNTKASCRRRAGERIPPAEKFGDLIAAGHNVLDEKVTYETIDTLSWYKILPLNGFNLIRVKQKLHGRMGKSSIKFLERSVKLGVVYTDNYVEFSKSCEELSWNH